MDRPHEMKPGRGVAPGVVEEAIVKYRDTLGEDDFEFLLGLYEIGGNFRAYAKMANRSVRDVHQQLARILAAQETTQEEIKEKKGPRVVRKDGRSVRRGLRPNELRVILEKYDFTPREQLVIEARMQSPNQMMASLVLKLMLMQEMCVVEEVSYAQYVGEYIAIREKYDF